MHPDAMGTLKAPSTLAEPDTTGSEIDEAQSSLYHAIERLHDSAALLRQRLVNVLRETDPPPEPDAVIRRAYSAPLARSMDERAARVEEIERILQDIHGALAL